MWPDGVTPLRVSASKLARRLPNHDMPVGLLNRELEDVFHAVATGQNVLIFCINGRHRSALVTAMVLWTSLGEEALDLIWKARSLVEWTAGRGQLAAGASALSQRPRAISPPCPPPSSAVQRQRASSPSYLILPAFTVETYM